MCTKRLCLLAIGWWCWLLGFGQATGYRSFQHVIAGSEATTVSAFAQDSIGMMWFGTNQGLVSYDGYGVQLHYRQNDSTNTFVYSIVTLDDRLLCLGTDHGVLFYDYQTDTYLHRDTPFPSDVRAMLLDGNDLWIGSLKGLYRYRLDSQQIEHFGDNTDGKSANLTVYARWQKRVGAICTSAPTRGFIANRPTNNRLPRCHCPGQVAGALVL